MGACQAGPVAASAKLYCGNLPQSTAFLHQNACSRFARYSRRGAGNSLRFALQNRLNRLIVANTVELVRGVSVLVTLATRSGHVEASSLRKQHSAAFVTVAKEAGKNGKKAVRPFVLYSLRHTFLTRLGESGCDAWTLARIAGHSSIAISNRYVHPSEDAVFTAMTRLGGHKIGHSGGWGR